MQFLRTGLLMLVVFPLIVFSKRRRVSFTNCPSVKSNRDLLTVKPAQSKIQCSVTCLNDENCLSASYCKTSDGYTCQLSRNYVDGSCSGLPPDDECTQTAVLYPCENGGTFISHNRTCICTEGFVGDYCQRRYRDCMETPIRNMDYIIQPYQSDFMFTWRCLNPDRNHSLLSQFIYVSNANRLVPWQQMREGIPINRDFFFLGLENLHHLTKQGVYDLLVGLFSFGNDRGYVWYRNIKVDSEVEGYALHWDDFELDSLYNKGPYLDGFGGAGDASKNLNGARFGTYDNDVNGCARDNAASWWYNPRGCIALIFVPNGLHWPMNRSGTVELEYQKFVSMELVPVYWYEEDDLIL